MVDFITDHRPQYEVKFAVLAWAHWLHTGRFLEAIGYVRPAEYGARDDEQAQVA